MREMVFRERQERVAQMEAIAKMISRVFGDVDADKAFGGILSEYAAEVFQETYDPDLLRRRVAQRRAAQAQVRARKQRDIDLMKRLDLMGEHADQVLKKAAPSAKDAPKKGPPKKKPRQSK